MMALTRREICTLLPALMAMAAVPGEAAETHPAIGKTLSSSIYNYKDLVAGGDKDQKFLRIFAGKTSSGMFVSLHETELAPDTVVHGSLTNHAGDELFMVREGTLEVELEGKRSQVGPGSVAYVAANTEYAIRNTGKNWTRYFVLFFGSSKEPENRKHSI